MFFLGKRRAYTLSELLVVVIVLGILAAVAVPKYMRVMETRKTTEAESFLEAVRTEQEQRCVFGKDYRGDLKDVKVASTAGQSKQYEYRLLKKGMAAQSRSKDYTLRLPSYKDGRMCCDGAYCAKLNKGYPPCTELAALAAAEDECSANVEEDCRDNANQAKCCGPDEKWDGAQCVKKSFCELHPSSCECEPYASNHPCQCGGTEEECCGGTVPAVETQTCNNGCGRRTSAFSCNFNSGQWQISWGACDNSLAGSCSCNAYAQRHPCQCDPVYADQHPCECDPNPDPCQCGGTEEACCGGSVPAVETQTCNNGCGRRTSAALCDFASGQWQTSWSACDNSLSGTCSCADYAAQHPCECDAAYAQNNPCECDPNPDPCKCGGTEQECCGGIKPTPLMELCNNGCGQRASSVSCDFATGQWQTSWPECDNSLSNTCSCADYAAQHPCECTPGYSQEHLCECAPSKENCCDKCDLWDGLQCVSLMCSAGTHLDQDSCKCVADCKDTYGAASGASALTIDTCDGNTTSKYTCTGIAKTCTDVYTVSSLKKVQLASYASDPFWNFDGAVAYNELQNPLLPDTEDCPHGHCCCGTCSCQEQMLYPLCPGVICDSAGDAKPLCMAGYHLENNICVPDDSVVVGPVEPAETYYKRTVTCCGESLYGVAVMQ